MSLIRFITRFGYAPLFFVGFIWSALTLAEQGAPLWALPVLLGFALAASAVAERLAPKNRSGTVRSGTMAVT